MCATSSTIAPAGQFPFYRTANQLRNCCKAGGGIAVLAAGSTIDFAIGESFSQLLEPFLRNSGVLQLEGLELSETREVLDPRIRHRGPVEQERLELLEWR